MSLPEVSLRALAAEHAALLLDAYGVLVDGEGPIEGAVDFVRELNASGQPYLILTNDASKRPETGAARYGRWGLALPAERIVTSGSLLTPYFAEHGLAGARTLVLGPEDSLRYARDAGAEVLPIEAEDAEVLVVCDEAGFDLLWGLDHALSVVLRRLERGDPIRLVLPNPDLIYPKRPGEYGIAAGSMARMIEDAIQLRFSGQVDARFDRLGKPYRAIFAEAERRLGTRDLAMVGDQLATDVLGARRFGITAGLVTWGLTRELPPDLAPERAPTHRVVAF